MQNLDDSKEIKEIINENQKEFENFQKEVFLR